MRSFRSDPYLWVHLAGVAAVPIFLELCLLGLGMGRFLMPVWFELLFVGGLGILPILWMQWQKPFCIFSLLLLALQPDQMSEEQRKILGLFKSPVNQFLSVGVAGLMAGLLWQFYQVAPIANGLLFPTATRGTGLLVAAIAFFFANLFLQVPASALRVLLVGESVFAATDPYPVEQIPSAFTLIGWRVKKILPALIPKPSKPVVIRPVAESVPQEPQKPEVSQKIEKEIQQDSQDVVTEVAEVAEGILPEIEAIAGIVEEAPAVEEAIAPVIEESIEEPIEEPETLLNNEGGEEATIEAELEATVDAIAAEAETILEEFEEAIAADVEEPEMLLEEGIYEEAIAQQEPEVVVSEIVELEIIELDGVALGDDAFPDADEIIEAVEIEVVEVEVVETIGEPERAIAPDPDVEDWGEDDLDDL
jgi:hypothetical protein